MKTLPSSMQQIRSAFIWTRLLGVPFWGMLYLFSLILYKEIHISPLQISIILTLKPVSALVAPYWSQSIYQRPDLLLSNLVKANILRYLPFLFLPWIQSAWILILAFGLYMMFYRGVIPVWMEIIKSHLPDQEQRSLIAYGSILDYAATALLPLLLGIILDNYDNSWRFLFLCTALIGLLSTLFLYRLPISQALYPTLDVSTKKNSSASIWKMVTKKIFTPWKNSWELLKNDRQFLKFQCGFMLGGSGLMIIQPTLPMFFVDILHLSYTKMLIALTLFKGIGFALAMPLWVRLFHRWNIYRLSSGVTALATLFPLLLLYSQGHLVLLYLAYVFYGMMQAGSELSWHISGPTFAKEKNSVIFSETNVLAVGLRGCMVPPLGALLHTATSSTVVMLVGSLLCFLAFQYLFKAGAALKKEAPSS